MAKKNHYYVLVFTNEGPVYVTSVNNSSKYARWDKNEQPLEFSASYAEGLVFGLNANFYNAVMVKTPVTIDCQPYRYIDFDCSFVEKKKEEK